MNFNSIKKILDDNWSLIFSLLLGAWILLPLFYSGFFSMHDNEQIARLFDLDQALKAGQFPVRILPNLGFGYGYPLFNFYPPFVYYFAEIFKILGFGYIDSIKIMIGSGFIFSFAFMFLFAREYFGNLGGSVGAAAYLYAPYHSVDAYVRGALPELWSFVFIPAIFWSLKRLERSNKVFYIVLSSVFGAGLIVSHNLIAMMLAPFLGAYFIYLLNKTKNKYLFIKQSILSLALGLSLSAFFWLPSFLERKYTAVNILTIELANYNQHFVCARQFIFSKWGYSGSVPGCIDGLSFNIGFPQFVLLILTGVFLLMNLKRIRQYKIQLLFILFLAVSLFMQTIHSKFIWDKIELLSYVQFPWRFLVITSFASSFLIASVFAFNFNNKYKILLSLLAIFSIFFFNKGYFKPQEYYLTATDSDYTNKEHIRWEISNLAAEYVPNGVSMKKTKFGNTAINIEKGQVAKRSYKVLSGKMDVKVTLDKPQIKNFEVETNVDGVFQAQTFSFPGWDVSVDNEKIEYNDNNSFKLITFPLKAGSHNISLVFRDTLVRKAANLASLVALFSLIALVLAPNRLKYPLKSKKHE